MSNPKREMLYEATDNLVNQQFYRNGTDTIFGRTQEISVKIKNCGQVISKFKHLFNENIHLFIEGRYEQFIKLFKQFKGLNDDKILKEIYTDLENKLEAIIDADVELVVLYTIFMSSLISRIREIHFDSTIEEIKKRVNLKSQLSDDKIQEELNQMFMKNNDNISILYNLSYLDALAESYNYKRVANTCKIQKGKFINRVVNIILKAAP